MDRVEMNQAISEFSTQIRELYKDRIENIIVYGSGARGEYKQESDIDVLIALKDFENFWEEFKKIGKIASSISLKYDAVISAIPVKAKEYASKMSPLMINVRKEGIPV